MAKYNLNFTGNEVSELLEKIQSSEIFTAAEKTKLAGLSSGSSSGSSSGGITQEELDEILAELKKELSQPTYSVTLADMDSFTGSGFIRPAGTISVGGVYAYTDYIDVSNCITINAHIRASSASVSPAVWYDADKNYISGEKVTVTESTAQDHEIIVPDDAVYARFSTYTQFEEYYVTAISTNAKDDIESEKANKIYLAANGDDSNDGLTKETPIATFDRAKKILDPNGELVLLEGDYESLSVDLGAFSKLTADGNVRLIYNDMKFDSATLVDGYTRVYQASCTSSFTNPLWQHDVPDARTEILMSEKHTLQRHRTYRLLSTRILHVSKVDSTSSDLTGYLTTMENNTENYYYYTDGTNIYFTAPSSDFANHPIIKASKTALTAKTANDNVYIRGLNVLYAQIKVTGLKGTIEDVSVLGGYNDACINWNDTFNLFLVRCEVAGSDRDGINGHYTGDITCVDCWGHDCLDDGESSHEECRITQFGGLYEYNVNSCTPASGAMGTYYNVIARHSTNRGFSASGANTIMICNGCVALDTITGFMSTTSAYSTIINCVTDCGYSGDMTKLNSVDID